MIGSRLYLKIYLTVIGALALVGVILSVLAFSGKFDTHGPLADRADRLAAALFADGLDGTTRQEFLDRLALGLDADIAIFDPAGQYLQGAGDRMTAPDEEPMPRIRRHYRVFDSVMPDGNRVVAYVRNPPTPPRRNLIAMILITAAATGIAAYPAVRHLTRRLEKLRQGVEIWGAGALSERVEVRGRDEIAEVARSFNQAADRVERLIKSQKSLLANASHELRSPLARLRMAVEMFEVSRSEDLKAEIIKNLAELDELVEEILLKSRLGSDRPPPLDQSVDLLSLAAEEAAAGDAEVDGDQAVITGNEKLLRRMIRNLVQNAGRHGRPPVSVSVRKASGLVRISVTDHGDGLNAAEAERVFEPFYRPEGRSESAGGWGLGLALVAEIARLHGGRAFYDPPEGGGAGFTVEIPLAGSTA